MACSRSFHVAPLPAGLRPGAGVHVVDDDLADLVDDQVHRPGMPGHEDLGRLLDSRGISLVRAKSLPVPRGRIPSTAFFRSLRR